MSCFVFGCKGKFFGGNSQKIKRFFGFCSLIRYFSRCEKVLSLENTKKNKFSFGILLAYSLLFALREGTFARKYKEKQVFLWYFARLFVPLQPLLIN